MRYWFSFLISFCFIICSLQSNGGIVYEEKTNGFVEVELPVTTNTSIGYQQPIADLLYLHQQRNSNTYFNHSVIAGSAIDLVTDKKLGNAIAILIPKFLYCKSIGLILIFPKHYFF